MVHVNQLPAAAYIDFGSSCTTIRKSEANKLKLHYDSGPTITLVGYGNGRITSIGKVNVLLKIDEVCATVEAIVVPDSAQEIALLIGRTFTEQPGVIVIKDDKQVYFRYNVESLASSSAELERQKTQKVELRVATTTSIPPEYVGNIHVVTEEYVGDLFVDNSFRLKKGEESCVPAVILNIDRYKSSVLPVVNLSDHPLIVQEGKLIARGWGCKPDKQNERPMMRIQQSEDSNEKLPSEDIIVGTVTSEERLQLENLLNEYRDCFALSTTELGKAKSTQMDIILSSDQPFVYRPYRMARSEQQCVNEIVNDLLSNDIIRESDSDFSSPILLVKKKNGEQRMCIDYRKLNAATVKENYPLPRVDDQIDRLHGGVFFTSLDLKSGYYQVQMMERAKRYTAFVTSSGQYEFNRMPFGLTNAPRVFQRLMNRVLKPVDEIAAVYLDDVLLHAKTVESALQGLRKVLQIFREEGLTLNLKKCSFLMTSVTFLGFEVGEGKIKPGTLKTDAVNKFEPPKSVHQVRQFLGLTGYFRNFIKEYGIIARPLTNLLKKTTKWQWTSAEETAFRQLQKALSQRPILALYNSAAVTEVHTDASKLGLAGILLQEQTDTKLHPVAYFSRQTTIAEANYHSYELETLAVVESLQKFRSYLLGIHFVVVTDCNAIKATSLKKQIIPRIARWWLQLQEFTFEVKYRPGDRMKHVDALSRNPVGEEQILHIRQADWILSGQLTDERLRQIHTVLSRSPQTEQDRSIHRDYQLRDGRIYRSTKKGTQWVVPRGMRSQVVRAAHDDLGHFALEKTLKRLEQDYWFPDMKEYVEKYIACCIKCLYGKRLSGRKEGFLHPIKKIASPLNTFHVDHLGPFPKSCRGNLYLIVGVDGFTKFTFLKAVKSTKAKYVIEYFRDIFCTYGCPQRIVSDLGSSFTSKHFKDFCYQNGIHHVTTAVATPRANGQVERLNRSILSALLTTVVEETKWDVHVRDIQFAINNVQSKTTGHTASQLLFGYTPRGGSDSLLRDEIVTTAATISERLAIREEAMNRTAEAQASHKKYFDAKRKAPRIYKKGDLVLVEKQNTTAGTSRKLTLPYAGPMVIQEVLPNDRYRVRDMPHSHRTSKKVRYEATYAADKIRPWCPSGGVSDTSEGDDEESMVSLSDGNGQTKSRGETS